MSKKTANKAILFADIARSTQLYEKLGDEMAQSLISSVLKILSEVTRRYNGVVIKTIGDEIMCVFDSAVNAVEAARAMQESLNRKVISDKFDMMSPNIYVGLHIGPVIKEKGDVFGDAVNVAARMVDLAKPRQILTTEETVKSLSPELKFRTECVDTTIIKGKSGEIKIYEVVWEHQDQTVMVNSLINSQTFRLRMEVKCRGRAVEIDQDHPVLTIGRQAHNDLIVDDGRVSRSHARIEYKRGKFLLIDQSSNGTYILPEGGKNTKVRRDETPLFGHGIISLGRMPDPGNPDIINFTIKS